jgi:hypothetical protein
VKVIRRFFHSRRKTLAVVVFSMGVVALPEGPWYQEVFTLVALLWGGLTWFEEDECRRQKKN